MLSVDYYFVFVIVTFYDSFHSYVYFTSAFGGK